MKEIRLTDNTAKARLFVAISMKPIMDKSNNVVKTIGGKLDVTVGGVIYGYEYIIRAPHTVTASPPATGPNQGIAYGSWADLRGYYALNSPTTSVIALKDHYNTDYATCFLLGENVSEPLSVIIEGAYAHYIVPIRLLIQPS